MNFYSIDDIENIYGTSVGGLIGLVICLKLNWEDIVEHAINRPWQKLFLFTPESLLDIIARKGLLKKDFFYAVFDNFFKNAGLSKDATMKDIYEYSNINLHVFTVNLSTFTLVNISHKTHPDTKVLDAVYMSCSMPFIFQPNFIDNAYYLDGGVINPYPLNICLNNHENKDEILAFKIFDDTLTCVQENSTVFTFGFYLLYRLIKENYNYDIKESIPNELIIPSTIINMEDASKIMKDPTAREKMIEEGKKYAKLFLEYRNSTPTV